MNKLASTILVLSLFVFFIFLFGFNYVEDILSIEEQIQLRGEDKSLVMGRISGFFIGTSIILEEPFLGVGLGNYSLVRNNPNFLGVFPPVDDWDLTGLGGIFTMAVESGVLGVTVFAALIFGLYSSYKRRGCGFLIFLFLFPLLLGVQLYFLYPWFAIALGLSFGRDERLFGFGYESSN